jgi:hypothetical protein
MVHGLSSDMNTAPRRARERGFHRSSPGRVTHALRAARASCREGLKNNSSWALKRALKMLLGARQQDANFVVDKVEIEEKFAFEQELSLKSFREPITSKELGPWRSCRFERSCEGRDA